MFYNVGLIKSLSIYKPLSRNTDYIFHSMATTYPFFVVRGNSTRHKPLSDREISKYYFLDNLSIEGRVSDLL